MTSQSKTILVLGGGIGGIVTATQLRKQLPSEHRVVLIEREPSYVFAPSFPWLMAGLRRAETLTVSILRWKRIILNNRIKDSEVLKSLLVNPLHNDIYQ